MEQTFPQYSDLVLLLILQKITKQKQLAVIKFTKTWFLIIKTTLFLNRTNKKKVIYSSEDVSVQETIPDSR